MLELILWIVLGLSGIVLVLLCLSVIIGYVTQQAYLEHLDDWRDND